MKNADKRLKHLKDFELLDLTGGIVQSKRLPVFEEFVKSDETPQEEINATNSEASAKKTSLKLKSRVFVMPAKKASSCSTESSAEDDVKDAAQPFINQVCDSGKAQ